MSSQPSAAARGDDDALSALVRTYHDRVYRYGKRVCRDGYDADDAVQQAFAKLAKRPDMLDHPGVLWWLLRVVRNACLLSLRPLVLVTRVLGRAINPEQAASPDADPHQALERLELVQAVHAAIAELERPYREVLVMRDLEGLSGEETCAALGLELAAVKTRLHRARKKLREALQQHAPEASREELH
ncbi:MAG: family polymerase sigma factor [Myxococcaceae bacterium]|nr:family polymerase sigma factor [Myxococcaceae bacterium]